LDRCGQRQPLAEASTDRRRGLFESRPLGFDARKCGGKSLPTQSFLVQLDRRAQTGRSLADQIAQIVGVPEVDAAVDCVGFEAREHGKDAAVEQPATVLNAMMAITRAGGSLGIPGLYVTGDPGGVDANAKIGNLGLRMGLGWAKSHSFHTGQCPVLKYNRQLMQAILHDKIQIAKAVNVHVISLEEAPKGYQDFDKGAANKFVIDPHGTLLIQIDMGAHGATTSQLDAIAAR
jgi:threonine dehydrogenase-like Zn-dependent dehydrogenase